MKIKFTLSSLIVSFVIFLLVFQNLILTLIPLPDAVGYWDEAAMLLLTCFWLICILHNSLRFRIQRSDMGIFICLLGIILIGLFGNLWFGYAGSFNAILRDIVGFIKFPMTYIVIRSLHLDKKIGEKIEDICVPLFKFIITIMFILGIISIFIDIGLSQNEIRNGIVPYQFLFSHPTFLVMNNICILAILNADGKQSNIKYDVMIVANIVLSMRTKGIALIAVYIFIKYAGNWLKKFKVIYWLSALGVIVLVGFSKMLLYSSFTSSPREALYKGSLILLNKCFPIGSGFGTFASHLSGKFSSKVYDFIFIPSVWNDGVMTSVLGDSGFPYYIGQFGFLGSILFIVILILIFKTINKEEHKLSAQVIFVYILIALTTESILINNGFELALILAVTFSAANRNSMIPRKAST